MNRSELSHRRSTMVRRHVAARVLDAMREVPREQFAPRSLQAFAFDDVALPVTDDVLLPLRAATAAGARPVPSACDAAPPQPTPNPRCA